MEKLVHNALKEGGKILMNYFGKVTSYEEKESQSSIVTKADIECEKLIMELIGRKFPGHNTIGEETGFQQRGAEYTWVIDPLDGTSNFAAGLPWFGIIICVLENDKPVMAGCYLPFYNDIYFAEKGKGASKNGKQISVAGEQSLKNVLFCYGLDYSDDFKKTDAEARLFGEMVKNTRNLRATNCLIDFCYTAEGRVGGCINQATKIWDIAGPALIVEEAGGIFTCTSGKKLSFAANSNNYGRNYSVAGGNKWLHPQIIEIIENTK